LAQVPHVWLVAFVQVSPEAQFEIAVHARVEPDVVAPPETLPAASTVHTRMP
jgi:hypothetical protein